ncbi:MAG: prephenate dehydrogenase [Ruthenibacterium sp.]
MRKRNFCIVGLGLLGGSYAMGLTQAGYTVTAIDIREEAIDYALQKGIITQGKTDDFAPLLAQADAVILALYPHALVAWVKEHQSKFKSGCFLTDVCGVKTGVVDEIQGFLRRDVEFIASHPMAGREVSGVEYANCDMFKPANFIITPTEKNSKEGIAFAEFLAKTLHFAHISVLSCAEHDKMIGYVSQLTHAIAVSLMNANDNTHLAEYTGDSFRDLTRIAHINETLWSELFLLNQDVLTQEIDAFTAALTDLKNKLKAGDEKGLQQLFKQSTERRAQFDVK